MFLLGSLIEIIVEKFFIESFVVGRFVVFVRLGWRRVRWVEILRNFEILLIIIF